MWTQAYIAVSELKMWHVQALARGPVSDIFGSNGSPSMIALASPEKAAPPDLPQGFSAPAMYPQHAGMLAYGQPFLAYLIRTT